MGAWFGPSTSPAALRQLQGLPPQDTSVTSQVIIRKRLQQVRAHIWQDIKAATVQECHRGCKHPTCPCQPERSRVLSADTHLRPGRSAANRSLGGRWTLRLLPPAASWEGAPPLPGPPPPPSGPGPRPELWSPIHNARAGAMAIASTSRAPTAGRAGRRGAG